MGRCAVWGAACRFCHNVAPMFMGQSFSYRFRGQLVCWLVLCRTSSGAWCRLARCEREAALLMSRKLLQAAHLV